FVDSHDPDGSLYFVAVDAAAGGSPCVQPLAGSDSAPGPSAFQPGPPAGPPSFGLTGPTASPPPPTSPAAPPFSCLPRPPESSNAPSCFFTDHCRYCSEKSGFAIPALMYRCSINAVVEKMVQTPRCDWLRTGDCSATRSVDLAAI